MTSRRPTLADVARAASVSPATASMALNDRPGVSHTTRLAVIAQARRLGYRRPGGQRDRARRGGGLIGVLPTDLGNTYHTDVIRGIEEHAASQDVGVVIAHGRRDAAHMERQLQRLLDLGVDGIIVVSTWLGPAALEDAARIIPITVIGRMQDAVPGTDVVRNDDEAGAALAVRHLVERGHRHLAHVTLSTRPGPAARRSGFLAAAARHGLQGQVQVIGPHDVRHGIEMILRALQRGAPDAPTGVFAANDMAAVKVLHHAADRSLPVPERLSIIGYDGSTVALTVRPHLTSVHQPRAEMGRLAAQMQLERWRGRDHDIISVVEPVLKVRESTGPGPALR